MQDAGYQMTGEIQDARCRILDIRRLRLFGRFSEFHRFKLNEVVADTLELKLKSSIFDRTRKLTISPAYFEFDDRSSVGLEPSRFEKEEIEGLRCGVKPIEGYQFVIGRIYCIDIRNKKGKIIKLRLKSLYGVRKVELGQKYVQIVNTLLDYFFDDIARRLLEKFNKGEPISILGVNFSSEGAQLSANAQVVKWEDLGTKSYARYYTLFSKANPNYYKAFEYLIHWNTPALYSISRQILKDKGFWNEEAKQ